MTAEVLNYLIFFLAALYVVSLIVLLRGLRRVQTSQAERERTSEPGAYPAISVVVSARNEQHNIDRLVSCLTRQDYPREQFEVILVDDRSEDETWNLLQAAAREHSYLNILRITDTVEGFAPKKRAIDTAIRKARGEIILLTDADCTPPPAWARSVVSYYQNGVAGVVGYSPYRFDTPMPDVLQGMLALEYFSFFAIAAASAGFGRALSASGTNFSYRKRVFLDIGGFESVKEIVSGDDDLIVHEVARKNAGRFSFALSKDAHVPAAAPKSLRQFWHQRIRYASKGRLYGGAMTAGLVAVFLFNLLLIAGLLGPLMGLPALFWMSVGAWSAKSVAEFSFLNTAASMFHERRLLRYIIPTAVVHPLYIVVFGFLGLFAPFKWKE